MKTISDTGAGGSKVPTAPKAPTAPSPVRPGPVATLTITAAGQAQFRFAYDEGLIAELKAGVGAGGTSVCWNGTLRAWTVRVRPANIRAIVDFARAHGFAGVDGAQEAQRALFAEARETIAASRAGQAEFFVQPTSLRGVLRPFQRAGVAYLVKARRGLLADEMGLGKTVEAIATLEALGAFPAVIVAPAGLVLNWEREFQAWAPHRTVEVVSGFAASNEEEKSNLPSGKRRNPRISESEKMTDVVIVSYNVLASQLANLRKRKNQAVVFDEGHLLKTATTKRSVAARALRRGVDVRLLLTGTPVLNSVSELLNPLTILRRLDDLGGFWHFVKRYCDGKEVERPLRGSRAPASGSEDQKTRSVPKTQRVWDISGNSNLTELAGRLRATCMVRRRKKDVLAELPPKHLAVCPVEIDNRAEYDDAARDVLKWVARKAGRDPVFRASLEGLDETAQIERILVRAQEAVDRAAGAEELLKINALRQIAARGKIEMAREWIGNFRADSPCEKLVVFGWHSEVLHRLAEAFQAPVIDGDTPLAKRQAIVDAFQVRVKVASGSHSPLSPSLLFLNLQAGGVGLTLTAASHCLVLELPWTAALLDQAVDRLHRIGQQCAVTAWIMLARRTLDFPIWKLLQTKRQTADQATA